jgi:alpha-galactosidase
VGLFNISQSELKIGVSWALLGISGKQNVRDLWRQKNLGAFTDQFESEVPPHGVVLLKISK